MRALLLYDQAPDQPQYFVWSKLVQVLGSCSWETRCAWWIVDGPVPSLPDDLLRGVMTPADLKSFSPDLILMDGRPESPTPGRRLRKIPWHIEQDFLAAGGSLIFLGAKGDHNDPRENEGFLTYGFPLALSKRDRKPAYLQSRIGEPVRISHWELPHEWVNQGIEVVDNIEFSRPCVLNDHGWLGEALIYAPSSYDAKDPVWVYEPDLDGCTKPYAIAAHRFDHGYVVLFTGDAFSDVMIGKGNNALLLEQVLSGALSVREKHRLTQASGVASRPMPTTAAESGTSLMYSIFLSHTHQDKPFVRRFARDLARRGVRVWVDEAEMKIGDSLLRKIERGIKDADYVGVILSRAALKSEWVQRELDAAMTREIAGRRVVVLPLVIEAINEGEMPAFLSGKLYADLSKPDKYEEGLGRILDRLSRRLIAD